MAVLTPVGLDDARRIGEHYGLRVAGLAGIAAGGVNTNYEVRLEGGGRAFLRVFEAADAAGVEDELRLIEHLAGRGVPAVRPLLPRGSSGLCSHMGKPAAMFPWIEGETLCQARVTEGAAVEVGGALARIHLAGADFKGALPGCFDAARLMERIEGLRRAGYGRAMPGGFNAGSVIAGGFNAGSVIAGGALGADVERLASALRGHLEGEPGFEGPGARTLLHGDLFRDNVIWRGDKIAAVLDFEYAQRGAATFDLSVAMLSWCYGDTLDARLCRALVGGYVRERELSGAERERFYGDARLAALRFSISRIFDYELRPKLAGVYKDYRRFLGRLAVIEGLGPGGWAEFLGV